MILSGGSAYFEYRIDNSYSMSKRQLSHDNKLQLQSNTGTHGCKYSTKDG
jgi:hypothetical protein